MRRPNCPYNPSMPTKLSVNINKVATLRNTRALDIPSVIHCARLVLNAGAHGITIHPRPDHRHIRPDDVGALTALLASFPGREFNIEGNPFFDYMPHIRAARPTQCTLVPDSTEAFTSDHGWALSGRAGDENAARLRPMIAEMKSLGCRVSLFMDADSPDIQRARDLGADRVELYTEPYAAAFAKGGDALKESLEIFAEGTKRALAAGMAINAGHDLNLFNLPPFIQRIPALAEVSIGHALIADALEFGLVQTVHKYLSACGS
jgi:pyridoxine 5-phosphate synthase